MHTRQSQQPQPTPAAASAAPRILWLGIIVLSTVMVLSGCSLDGLLLTELTRENNATMPDPAPVRIHGRAPGFIGATVTLLAETEQVGEGKVDAASKFTVELDGTTDLTNPVLSARNGSRQALGVLPYIPGQKSVLDPAIDLNITQLSPGMLNLDGRSTTLALLVLAKARATSRALRSVPATSMTDTLIYLNDRLIANDPQLTIISAMVQRLAALPGSTPPFQLGADKTSLLDAAALGATGFDYDGDGAANTTSAAFDAAMVKAVSGFIFKACYVPNKIRVVILARMAKNGKNRNCESFDTFLWAKDLPGRRMFLAAGVHIDTPRCIGERQTHCLTKKQIDALNATLGNWQPNRTRMYDDGSNGDAVAGDGVWTFSMIAPWWDAKLAPDKAGVRIAYKFTWGNDADGWTNTEEFPGNQRLLELTDKNGDQVIVRQDSFADETTNKDKANQLAPSLGGCGQVKWPTDSDPDCASDVFERAVDLTGDCKVDGWPSAGQNTALTVPCE